MKLKYEFLIVDMGDSFSAVAVGEDASQFHGMLKLNAVSADIMEQLKAETTAYDIHAHLKEKYPESTDDEIGQTLANFLTDLSRLGLLIS